MDEINTLQQLVERAARTDETLRPKFVAVPHSESAVRFDRPFPSDDWLVIDSSDGQYWFDASGVVMQVL